MRSISTAVLDIRDLLTIYLLRSAINAIAIFVDNFQHTII